MKTLAERFWPKVMVTTDGCWIWTGATDGRGYGHIQRGPRGAGTVKAHRVSWELHYGDPGDLFVCHHCDNPPCCNPAHLFLGTAKDNLADMAAKGRHFRHRQTHCKRGHEFTPENTRMDNGGVSRRCLECERERSRARLPRQLRQHATPLAAPKVGAPVPSAPVDGNAFATHKPLHTGVFS